MKQFIPKLAAESRLKVEKQIKKMPAQGKRILASVWDSEREQLGLELPDLQQVLN